MEPSATKPEEPGSDSASNEASADEEQEHRFRLAELRRQVETGSYTIDPLEVSKAVLRALSAGR